jgi:signal transduction histidine kinase
LPIKSNQRCTNCPQNYDPKNNLGLLLIDISMAGIQQHLLEDLRVNLAILVLVTVLLAWGIYYILNRLLVRRLEAFHQPLSRFAAGDLAARIQVDGSQTDELSNLASTFNRMAQELERHIHERVERSQMRQQVIIAERERIARELHDSLAQLLGYVKTKASAVRLNLENNQPGAAIKNLRQLEGAAQDLLMDVREAILNLKMSAQISSGLGTNLDLFCRKYARFSGLRVDLSVSPEIDNLLIDGEVETQLMRIAQESLSNIRKHASAKHIKVSLDLQDSQLTLSITDDGRGFDPERTQPKHKPSYGLAIMRERADSIGAQLNIGSSPNEGTKIRLQWPLNGDNYHAYPGRR